jgi:hypothetical protein
VKRWREDDATKTALVDIFALSYPSRRFQSAWMGIIVHSAQSVVMVIVVLGLVLD